MVPTSRQTPHPPTPPAHKTPTRWIHRHVRRARTAEGTWALEGRRRREGGSARAADGRRRHHVSLHPRQRGNGANGPPDPSPPGTTGTRNADPMDPSARSAGADGRGHERANIPITQSARRAAVGRRQRERGSARAAPGESPHQPRSTGTVPMAPTGPPYPPPADTTDTRNDDPMDPSARPAGADGQGRHHVSLHPRQRANGANGALDPHPLALAARETATRWIHRHVGGGGGTGAPTGRLRGRRASRADGEEGGRWRADARRALEGSGRRGGRAKRGGG